MSEESTSEFLARLDAVHAQSAVSRLALDLEQAYKDIERLERERTALEARKDREHIVKVPRDRIEDVYRWLGRPNGGLRVGRVTFESVEDGSIWVRTEPWRP